MSRIKEIPKVGDVVVIECDRYSGEAIVDYILMDHIYLHHFAPIQCQISEGDLHRRKDDSDQLMVRVSLQEIVSIQSPDDIDNLFVGEEQISLFDMY